MTVKIQTAPRQTAKGRGALSQWLKLVDEVIAEMRGWAEHAGWATHTETRSIQEDELGTYNVPVLRMKTPQGEVYAEPIARYILGGDGRVDLQAWPSHYRVKLVRRKDKWRIITDSNVLLKRSWGPKVFLEVTKELVATP